MEIITAVKELDRKGMIRKICLQGTANANNDDSNNKKSPYTLKHSQGQSTLAVELLPFCFLCRLRGELRLRGLTFRGLFSVRQTMA